MRKGTVERDTRETRIRLSLDLDGKGESRVQCAIGFFTHMLETFARHGLFDLDATIDGDLHVDQHHTVEDTGIVLGEALAQALGDKRGIRRVAHCVQPMDEALATVAVDLSGRPYLKWSAKFRGKKVGDLSLDLVQDFFLALTNALGANIHVIVHYGRSDHHKVEAVFKALARALRTACAIDARVGDAIPSTKGSL